MDQMNAVVFKEIGKFAYEKRDIPKDMVIVNLKGNITNFLKICISTSKKYIKN